MSYVDKLRMNNIFPTAGFNPLGPPVDPGINIDEISRMMNRMQGMRETDKIADFGRQKELLGMQQRPMLQNIANNAMAPPVAAKPMNYVMGNQGMSDFQRGSLNLRQQELGQKTGIARQGLDIRQSGIDVSNRRAALAEKIASGRATDAEKQEFELAKIDARGSNTTDQIKQRAGFTADQIGQRGNIQKDLQGVKGNQALAQIGARVAGNADVANINVAGRQALQDSRPLLPSQQRTEENIAARELVNTRPELAEFITQDEVGNFTVVPPSDNWYGHSGPTQTQYEEIQKLIYDKSKKVTTTKAKTPTVTTPKAPVSKYKVTVK